MAIATNVMKVRTNSQGMKMGIFLALVFFLCCCACEVIVSRFKHPNCDKKADGMLHNSESDWLWRAGLKHSGKSKS